jgi:proprotein convertase subtilisin/kexin type 5
VGFFGDSNQRCQSCHSSCLTCSSSLATNCLTCSNYFTPTLGTCTDVCLEKGFFPRLTSPRTCQPCAVGCDQCEANRCLECTSGLFLKSRVCVTDCGIGFISDQATKSCLPCDPSCGTCKGATELDCLTCRPNTFMMNNGSCVAFCLTGYFTNRVAQRCDPCTDFCDSCPSNPSNCTACKNGFYMFNNKCVATCPPGASPIVETMTCL